MSTSKQSTKATFARRTILGLAVMALLSGLMFTTAAADDAAPPEQAISAGAPFKGTLYLIGGGADESLQRFVDIAGGAQAVIAVLPHASGVPQEAADEAANLFTARGVKNIITIMPGQKVGLPKNVNAVYFTGGDQNRLIRLLDPVLALEIHDFLKRGGLVGGTSAGSAAAPPKMIAGGMEDKLVKTDSLLLGDGLGYLPGFVVDTHVLERCRHDRLMVALSLIDNVVGIGLDEDTAVEISGKTLKVWGDGHVRILKRSDKHSSNLGSAGKGNKANVRNMIYSVLSQGDDWEL
jgi:cyanophycinase